MTSQPISGLRESTSRRDGEEEGEDESRVGGLSSLEEVPEGSREGTRRTVRFPSGRGSVDEPVSPMTIVQHRSTSPLSDSSAAAADDAIAKASEVVDSIRTAGLGGRGAAGMGGEMRSRLDGIEERQKRIEDLLQMLVDQRGLTEARPG